MFGTDQMQWPGAIERAIRVTEAAPFLSVDERRDVMCRNAARFLRRDEAICAENGVGRREPRSQAGRPAGSTGDRH
jgi:hypothetical protein